jgi:hypothetical protein
MRKIFFFLFITGVVYSNAQTHSLVGVTLATPKLGQAQAFESAWVAHLKKFHQADTTNRRSVFEIIDGPRTGCYYLVTSGMSWDAFDVDRANQKDHDMDLATNVSPTLSSQGGLSIYRWADTLSYNGEAQPTKYLLTAYHIKAGRQDDLTDEIKRSIAVDKKINSPVSFNGYILTFSGTTPMVVVIRNLKNGFKELDPDYYKGLNDQFKAAYLQLYGQAQWDKRMHGLAEYTDLTESEMIKYRPDLSSAQ